MQSFTQSAAKGRYFLLAIFLPFFCEGLIYKDFGLNERKKADLQLIDAKINLEYRGNVTSRSLHILKKKPVDQLSLFE